MSGMRLDELAERGLIASDWVPALAPVANNIAAMGDFLRAENAARRGYFPPGNRVLRAFEQPMAGVRVLIVGQDPYPTPGHAIGLSFAVDREVRPIPRSLQNIYRELEDDLGIAPCEHGDLSRWAQQGVMLLNRSLTVQPGKPASHRGRGWEAVTECAIRALAHRGGPLVAILWGNDARRCRQFMPGVPAIESAHPSPLSASRGFFGSRPFSRANEMLVQQAAAPIDWRVDETQPLPADTPGP